MAVSELIDFARARGCDVTRQGEAHAIKVDAAPLSVEVLLPDDAPEWCVKVSDAQGREVYSEWCDHDSAAISDDIDPELTSSVEAFISAIKPGCLRVEKSDGSTRLEAYVQDAWVPLWEGRLTRPPPPVTTE